MQASLRCIHAGLQAAALALAVIATPIVARADSPDAPASHEDTDDSASILATDEGRGSAGIDFGEAGSVRVEMDPVAVLKFTNRSIGDLLEDSVPAAVEGMTFDNAGNLFVAHFSTKTIAKFEPDGTVLFLPPAEFGPPDAFLAIHVGPIPEPAALGVLAGVALLGIGAGKRMRRGNASAVSR